jgi:hypothetical protein
MLPCVGVLETRKQVAFRLIVFLLILRGCINRQGFIIIIIIFKKALTVLRGPLVYPNGLLDLYIETFGRTPWPGGQPDARPLPTQDNTTQKHADTHP